MIRAGFYLLAAGAIWLIEGFVFSRFLSFALWQTVLMVCIYVVLFAAASAGIIREMSNAFPGTTTLPKWRYISLAPMVAVILGSFASLPLLLALFALGKLA